MPSIVGIILLATEKYGQQIINTENQADSVAMWVKREHLIFSIPEKHISFCLLTRPSVPRCWITDRNVHYIVNIGYYALVFLFTFTTFLIIISWLICIKRKEKGVVKVNKNGKSIVTILGLCCMLGIAWGFAFFSYGSLQIPAFYIFTILNSLQGEL